MMAYIVCFIVAVTCFGMGFRIASRKQTYDGLFIFDDSDPDKIRWTLDVHIDPNDVQNKKDICLKVCNLESSHINQNLK